MNRIKTITPNNPTGDRKSAVESMFDRAHQFPWKEVWSHNKMKSKVIITISGPTASGKSTLESMLVAKYGYGKVKGTTTRIPRAEDADGSKYDFMTNEKFVEMDAAHEFVESICVIDGGYATYYGTRHLNVESAFKDSDTVVMAVDPDGAESIRDYYKESDIAVYSVFLDTPYDIRLNRVGRRHAADVMEVCLSTDEPRTQHANLITYINDLASRLDRMEEVERTWLYALEWDVIYPTFDENNQDRILDQINFIQGTLFTNIDSDDTVQLLPSESPEVESMNSLYEETRRPMGIPGSHLGNRK